MSNDFFDDENKDSADFIENMNSSSIGDNAISLESTSSIDKNRLMRQKEEIDGRVVVAAKEIDLLKRRQNELEARKKHMEEIALKQSEYEKNKREIIVQLDKSLILLEKEELQASRLVDLLVDTKTRFKDTLVEIKSIKEENWSDTDFEEDLNKAVVRVENAFMIHKRGLSKVDVISDRKKSRSIRAIADTADNIIASREADRGFGYWLKAGLAFCLPLMTMMVVLFVIYMFLNGLLDRF